MNLLIVLVALAASIWAGLLALAEDAPAMFRAVDEGPNDDGRRAAQFSTIHIGRLSLLLVAAVGAAIGIEWWTRPPLEALGVGVVAAAFLYMVTEALPRSVSALAPEAASAAAVFAARSVAPFRPLAGLVHAIEARLDRVVAVRGPEAPHEESMQRDLLLGVFSLGDTTVAEIMTPRLDIVAIDTKVDWNDAVDLVGRSEHSRIPVYTDTLDNVTGVLYAKDFVANVAGVAPVPASWHDLVRPVQFVPESKTIDAQLRDFQRGPAHIAVVVDEFGGTSGIITLEDVLEEIVGEIHDEYDVDEPPAVEREGADRFWVDGTLTLDELSALLGLTVPDDDVSTVGGFVYAKLGRVPRPGEEFRYGGFRVVVEQVVRRRVRRVYFERLDHEGHEVPVGEQS